LSAKNERSGYGFATFTKSLYEYCLVNMKSPQDIAPVILERKDPFVEMGRTLPTLRSIAASVGTPITDINDDEPTEEQSRKKKENQTIEENIKPLLATEISEFSKRRTLLRSNMAQLWGLVVGQCTPALQEHLISLDEYEAKHGEYDCVWLLQSLQQLAAGTHESTNVFVAASAALSQLLKIKQGTEETLEDYLARFKEYVDQVRLNKSKIFEFDTVPKHLVNESKKDLEERFLSIVFLRGADGNRYNSLWTTLENEMAAGVDKYPIDLAKSMHLLTTWKDPNKKQSSSQNGPGNQRPSPASERRDGLTFAQVVSETVPDNEGNLHPDVRCYNCNRMGHYATSCPSREAAIQGAHISCAHSHLLNRNDVLLDSQSTVSIVNNLALVRDLEMDSRGVRIYTNGGHIDADQKGCSTLLPKLENVWYNPESVANILSLAEVKKKYRVTMDSSVSDTFKVFKAPQNILEFGEKNGLYVLKDDSDKVNGIAQYSFSQVSDEAIPTPEEHSDALEIQTDRPYTQKQVRDADKAVELIRNMGYISPDRLIYMINHNMIKNCPIQGADVRRATKIYGPLAAMIQGKSTRRTAGRIPDTHLLPVPRKIYDEHKYVTICIDHFFVQGIGFFHTISKNLKFRTIEQVDDLTKHSTLQCLISVARLYQVSGFRIRQINGDMAYESLRSDLMPVQLVTAPAGEKVPEVERSIRTVKERLRCIVASLPYRKVPKAMLKSFVYEAGRHLNDSPPKDGVSRSFSPARIVANRPMVDYKKLVVRTGQYCMIIGTHQNWNGLSPRKIGAIALRPKEDGNGWYFLSLDTWRVVTCGLRNITVMEFTESVVRVVEERAEAEEMTEFRSGEILMQWRDRSDVDSLSEKEIQDLEGEDDHEPTVDVPIMIDEPSPTQPVPGNGAEETEEETVNHQEAEEQEDSTDEERDALPTNIEEDLDEVDVFDDNQEPSETVEFDVEGTIDREAMNEDGRGEYVHVNEHTDDASVANREESDQHNVSEEQDHETVVRSKYDLRPRRERNYDHLNFPGEQESNEVGRSSSGSFKRGALSLFMKSVMKEPTGPVMSTQDMYRTIVKIIMADEELRNEHYSFTQMSAKRGIAVFGKKAIEAIFKEFKQLHDKGVFRPIDPKSLTPDQKRKALREITIIKEKRCGKIKGRTCADGRPQRNYISKDESSSPTISNDAFLMSLIIDALEERDVATADVEGAYLNADMEDFVIMKITSKDHIQILCSVDEEYRKYIETDDSGNMVLYLQLMKALYGCIKSALLWYRLFAETLCEMGFTLNPMDKCVANKMINGKQCTVAWYVDDNKISHEDPEVVTDVINKIEERFGKMTVTRGKEHIFLGMNITFENKHVIIDMKSYCEEAIESYHRKVFGKAATPARRDIFEVDEASPPLAESLRENFHSITALLLYVSLRGRPDILLPVSFLCTRVDKATLQDDEKLLRVLKYLNGTLGLKYKLGARSLEEIKIWVDAAFAVHMDMKGHTGGLVSMGTGAFMCKSSKQKLNVLSSTECELVGAASYITNAIWLDQFLEHQGYPLVTKMFYQDNQSAIRFAKNGMASARKNSKHIDVRYFFLKDRLENNGYVVEHCRTTKMIADFFTKPLQGSLFRIMRDVVMGQKDTEVLEHFESDKETEKDINGHTQNEERVGKQVPMESFTDKSKQKSEIYDVEATYEEESERVEKKEFPRDHSFELTQSVVVS